MENNQTNEEFLRAAHKLIYGTPSEIMKWREYRFKVPPNEENPIVFNPAYPWWLMAVNPDQHRNMFAILPADEPLQIYWKNAYNIDSRPWSHVTFSDIHPQPKWYVATDI